MIELLVVLTFLSILTLAFIFTSRQQMAKGRDGKRKADLNGSQKILEDYLNDHDCYPDSFGGGEEPSDPLNNAEYNYFYSYDSGETCKSWYKIYAKLENEADAIIDEVGCTDGCGPSGNYNYWVSSPNMADVSQQPGEDWWPDIGPTPTPTPEPSGQYGCICGECVAVSEGYCSNGFFPNIGCFDQCGNPVNECDNPENPCRE